MSGFLLALRFIHFAKPRDHAIPLFISTKILPINFLFYQLLKLAETMSDISNNLVPTNIQELFLPRSCVHSYSTRSSTSQNFYIKKSNPKKLFLETLVPNYGMWYWPSCAHFQNTNSNVIFVIIAWLYWRLVILTMK